MRILIGAAIGLQAEVGAWIVDEIEFSVAASAVELELALRLSVIHGFASGDDRL